MRKIDAKIKISESDILKAVLRNECFEFGCHKDLIRWLLLVNFDTFKDHVLWWKSKQGEYRLVLDVDLMVHVDGYDIHLNYNEILINDLICQNVLRYKLKDRNHERMGTKSS